MNYKYDVSDNKIKIKSERKNFRSLTHNELEKCFQTNHIIESPHFFDADFFHYCNKKNRFMSRYMC